MYKNSNALIVEAEKEIDAIHIDNQVSLGSISASGPEGIINTAKDVSAILCKIVNENNLYANIRGKKYVTVEGWTTLGALLGIIPREVDVKKSENGDWEAWVELVRTKDGQVVGRSSAMVGNDEHAWKSRDEYAKRSMAITRATGKAFRLSFSFIMTLAGYAPTPNEEMPLTVETKEVVVVIDRDKIRSDLLISAGIGGSSAVRDKYQSLSKYEKNAFTQDEWPIVFEEIMNESSKIYDLNNEINKE